MLVASLGNSDWAGNVCVYMGIFRDRLHIEREGWAEDRATRGHEVPRVKILWQGCVLLGFPRWDEFLSVWAGLALHRGVMQVWMLSSVSCSPMVLLRYITDRLSFSFQFPFCLLHLPYFSAFTPDTLPAGFVLLCSHFFRNFSFSISFWSQPSCLLFPLSSRFFCSFFLFASHSLFLNTTPPMSILLFLPDHDWGWTFHSPSLFCASPPASI